ncbi:MAG: hypothetical protein AB7O39_03345 [Flavobacteriaceae bacterium]
MSERLDHANWDLLPDHIRGGVKRYIEHGVEPGGFLTAVICNDLKGALGKADDINRTAIFEIVQFFYMDAPAICWGSPEAFSAWIERGGLVGSTVEQPALAKAEGSR